MKTEASEVCQSEIVNNVAPAIKVHAMHSHFQLESRLPRTIYQVSSAHAFVY